MAWEYAGLFDAIPTEGDLLSTFWQTSATDIKVGSMGYRTATVKAGGRLEAEIYPIYGRRMEAAARKAKQKGNTPEAQKKLNAENAKRKLILILEENFKYFEDDTLTLTYQNEPADLKRCQMDIRNFFLRVKRWRKRNGLPELKYVAAIGHDADQRLHVHVAMNGGVPQKEIIKLWGKGITNSSPFQTYGKGLEGYANYLFKQNELAKKRGEREYIHMWTASRNLKNPLDHEHKSDCKISNRRVKQIARTFGADAKSIMEKIYPGYVLQEQVVPRFSDSIDGVYIRVIMRKVEGYNEKRAKNQKRPAHHSQIHEKAERHAEGNMPQGGGIQPGRTP